MRSPVLACICVPPCVVPAIVARARRRRARAARAGTAAVSSHVRERRRRPRRAPFPPRRARRRRHRRPRHRLRRHRHEPALRPPRGVRAATTSTVDPTSTYGVASIVFWALVIIISIKYLALVMRADNHGEGGILALTALVHATPRGRRTARPFRPARRCRRSSLVTLGVFGTALLYGDGLITPAISVLSAVEGFEVATSAFADWVIPVSVVILVALFSVQSRGTAGIARVFGPVMVVWFAVLGVLGLRQIVDHPGVLEAVWPGYAVEFFADEPVKAFLSLGSIFLVVTGGEALYADMGHFGRRPIQLVLVHLGVPGAAAQLLRPGGAAVGGPGGDREPVLPLGPGVGDHAAGVLATMATVIASQALISGAFSLTAQAIQLDYIPRLAVRHTSGDARRADLRAARQLAADDRLRRPRARLPLVERAGLGLRHRRHGDDGDHHAAVLPGRADALRLVGDEGDARRRPAAGRRPRVLRRQRPEDPPRRLVPAPRRRRPRHPDDDVAPRPRARRRPAAPGRGADGRHGGATSGPTSSVCRGPPCTCSRTPRRRRRR